MKLRNLLKKEKGITGIDVSISILIITVFTGILATLFYNIYITSMSVERSDTATNIAINIIEYANKLDYAQVMSDPDEGDLLVVSYKTAGNTIPNGYTCKAKVKRYIDMPGVDIDEDIIKILDVTITYPIGKKSETYSIRALKIKEL